jgi:hypothetical protein
MIYLLHDKEKGKDEIFIIWLCGDNEHKNGLSVMP